LKDISFKHYRCDDILQEFGEEKLKKRYGMLFDEMVKFLEVNKLQNKAAVNKDILANVMIDYFNDILRLKDFHVDIRKTNSPKVIAYTAYWLLVRKPIQITDDNSQDKCLATLNERFVLKYILDYLSESDRDGHILSRENKGLENFSGLMLYYIIYRTHDAQSLEMIITSFLAGQIYERTEKDISKDLHPFDN
jgi:hypothetical protein